VNPLLFLRKPKTLDESAMGAARERGEHAQALLRDEALMGAFAAVERVYMEAWRGSSLDQVELRERAHIAVSLLNDLKGQIISYVREGASASDRIESDRVRRARANA